MRTRIVTIVAALALFVTGAAAQHDHQTEPNSSPSDKPAAPGMKMGHEEIAKLVDQLSKSFEAIQTEKDPEALQTKLAAHGALLKELQAKVQAEARMMEMMHHMMGGDHKN